MNKKVFLLLLFLVIILTGCLNSPAKTIEKLEGIIEEKDAEKLYNLVSLEEDVYWSEQEAKDLIDYFTENKSIYEEQLSLLNDQKDALKQKEELLNKKGIFYFDENKQLLVRTYEVLLNENSFVEFEELIVSVLDNKEIKVEGGSDDHIKIGLFGPGHYNVKGHANYTYVTLEDTIDFSLFDDKNFTEEIELDLKGEKATVYSRQPDTALYINDSKVSDSISEEAGFPVQPIVDGLILQTKNEFSWGELVSDQVKYIVGETGLEVEITPYIFANEQEKEEIAHIITDFNEQLLKGLSENDSSYLDDVKATDEAIAGYNSDFETLDLVEKGELKPSSFPPGTAMAFIGHYEGELIESIIDFANAENIKDEATNKDLLVLKVNLYTDFIYIPEGFDQSAIDKEKKGYLEPIIHLKKENNGWIIAEQLINLKSRSNESELIGDELVKTKVGK